MNTWHQAPMRVIFSFGTRQPLLYGGYMKVIAALSIWLKVIPIFHLWRSAGSIQQSKLLTLLWDDLCWADNLSLAICTHYWSQSILKDGKRWPNRGGEQTFQQAPNNKVQPGYAYSRGTISQRDRRSSVQEPMMTTVRSIRARYFACTAITLYQVHISM